MDPPNLRRRAEAIDAVVALSARNLVKPDLDRCEVEWAGQSPADCRPSIDRHGSTKGHPMNFRINLPQSLAGHWDLTVIDGKLRVRQKPHSNQLDPARLAYIDGLKRDGWRWADDFSAFNFCEVFLHQEADYAIKVSRLYNPRASGWRDFATWTVEQRAAGELSPYLPRIWDLEIHERWFCAKMERLQEIDALDDAEGARIMNQIAEVRRRLHALDFSISEGDDADLIDVLSRMADRFKHNHDWTPDESNPPGWPRDRNFMIRPGEKPQLVLNDPISEELLDAQPAKSGLATLTELFVVGALIISEVGRSDRA